jgi:hypothetical protein
MNKNEDSKIIIHEEHRSQYYEFVKNIKYTFSYRLTTPQMIETVLEGYLAGAVFQKAADIPV